MVSPNTRAPGSRLGDSKRTKPCQIPPPPGILSPVCTCGGMPWSHKARRAGAAPPRALRLPGCPSGTLHGRWVVVIITGCRGVRWRVYSGQAAATGAPQQACTRKHGVPQHPRGTPRTPPCLRRVPPMLSPRSFHPLCFSPTSLLFFAACAGCTLPTAGPARASPPPRQNDPLPAPCPLQAGKRTPVGEGFSHPGCCQTRLGAWRCHCGSGHEPSAKAHWGHRTRHRWRPVNLQQQG